MTARGPNWLFATPRDAEWGIRVHERREIHDHVTRPIYSLYLWSPSIGMSRHKCQTVIRLAVQSISVLCVVSTRSRQVQDSSYPLPITANPNGEVIAPTTMGESPSSKNSPPKHHSGGLVRMPLFRIHFKGAQEDMVSFGQALHKSRAIEFKKLRLRG